MKARTRFSPPPRPCSSPRADALSVRTFLPSLSPSPTGRNEDLLEPLAPFPRLTLSAEKGADKRPLLERGLSLYSVFPPLYSCRSAFLFLCQPFRFRIMGATRKSKSSLPPPPPLLDGRNIFNPLPLEKAFLLCFDATTSPFHRPLPPERGRRLYAFLVIRHSPLQ